MTNGRARRTVLSNVGLRGGDTQTGQCGGGAAQGGTSGVTPERVL